MENMRSLSSGHSISSSSGLPLRYSGGILEVYAPLCDKMADSFDFLGFEYKKTPNPFLSFPEYYGIYSEKEFTYNKIRQENRISPFTVPGFKPNAPYIPVSSIVK